MKAPPLASIDIGSNSILLLISRITDDNLHIELQRKETIRLGGALDANGLLHPDAMARGLECLRRYAQLIAHIPAENRRAVATQTLREASNRHVFLSQARSILGCSVELISGEREATLIYQGVSGLLPSSPAQRLIIDIGGRSTEICTGQALQLHTATSSPLGSVAWSQRFFGDGVLSAERFSAADGAAQTLLAATLAPLQHATWQEVFGSSGTAGAISKALHQAGYPAAEINRTGLFQLRAQLIEAGHIQRLPLQGLREELRPVIGGGISVMCAVFDMLKIEHMRIAQGALRHGLAFEMHRSVRSAPLHPST